MLEVFFNPESTLREIICISCIWSAVIFVFLEEFIARSRVTEIIFMAMAGLSLTGSLISFVGYDRWAMALQTTPEAFWIGLIALIFFLAELTFSKKIITCTGRLKCLCSKTACDVYTSLWSAASLISFGTIASVMM